MTAKFMIPHSIFQLSMHHGIFDLTLTAVAIGDEPCCECTKAFLKSPLMLRAFRSYIFFSLQKSFVFVVKTNFSYFNESGHRHVMYPSQSPTSY